MDKKGMCYLSDGVYVHSNGYYVVLTANLHSQDEQTVHLDHVAILALIAFIERASGLKITITPSGSSADLLSPLRKTPR